MMLQVLCSCHSFLKKIKLIIECYFLLWRCASSVYGVTLYSRCPSWALISDLVNEELEPNWKWCMRPTGVNYSWTEKAGLPSWSKLSEPGHPKTIFFFHVLFLPCCCFFFAHQMHNDLFHCWWWGIRFRIGKWNVWGVPFLNCLILILCTSPRPLLLRLSLLFPFCRLQVALSCVTIIILFVSVWSVCLCV